MRRYDAIVVGAGFAGIACAKALAQKGCSVAVLERKADISKGIATTGILVHEAAELLALPPGLYKPISQVRLYGPSLRYIEVKSDRYIFLATDTPALMNFLMEDAQSCGVTFLFDTPFEDGRQDGDDIVINRGLASCRLLIGADGARSQVAGAFNLGRNTEFLLGVEAEYTGVEISNPEAFYCFLNQHHSPSYIGWIIPGPKVTQIGLATRRAERPDIAGFTKYVEPALAGENRQIVERRGGLIPVGGLVSPFYRENVILTGDAAGIVSPLTAGGIHTALYYGRRLGALSADYLQGKGPHPGPVLSAEYPRFRFKRLLRKLFNHTPNWCFDVMVATPGARNLAHFVFFLKKRLPSRKTG